MISRPVKTALWVTLVLFMIGKYGKFCGVGICFSLTLLLLFNAQAMSKDELYGTLDPNTREWTDGLFTHLLRK